MIKNLSSKLDSLSGTTLDTVALEMNETYFENLASLSRPVEINELPRDEGQLSQTHPPIPNQFARSNKMHKFFFEASRFFASSRFSPEKCGRYFSYSF